MLYFTKSLRGVVVQENFRIWRLLGLGWYVALCLVVAIVGGIWLDQQVHLSPLFLLLGLALGLVLAFVGVYRMIQESVGEEGNTGSRSNESG